MTKSDKVLDKKKYLNFHFRKTNCLGSPNCVLDIQGFLFPLKISLFRCSFYFKEHRRYNSFFSVEGIKKFTPESVNI